MEKSDPRLGSLLEDLEEPYSSGASRVASGVPESSVRLDTQKCVGCAACMRVCPTEAIRIRNGKAKIKPQLCIDCGECVRVCEHKAGIILSDPLSSIHRYDYKIAIPEASIYGQFIPAVLPNDILAPAPASAAKGYHSQWIIATSILCAWRSPWRNKDFNAMPAVPLAQ